MKLRLSDNFNTSNMDPATIALVANSLNSTQAQGNDSSTGSEEGGLDQSTLNVVSQYASVIDKYVRQAEETRLRELIDMFRSQFNFGAISEVSNLKLLNLAMAFDLELKRLEAEKAPANTAQGRIDRRYIAAFKVLNAAIDAEAQIRGYKRVGRAGSPADQYFLLISNAGNGGANGSKPGSSLVPKVPSMAGISNIAVLGLVGALGYMLLKK